MPTIHDQLKDLTVHVRLTKGPVDAFRFFVEYIQPIQKYFGGDEVIKEIELQTKKNDTEHKIQ